MVNKNARRNPYPILCSSDKRFQGITSSLPNYCFGLRILRNQANLLALPSRQYLLVHLA